MTVRLKTLFKLMTRRGGLLRTKGLHLPRWSKKTCRSVGISFDNDDVINWNNIFGIPVYYKNSWPTLLCVERPVQGYLHMGPTVIS